jgi:shikimate kinase
MLFSLDALIRYEAGGLTIPEIVEREGWPGFREREYAVVRKLSAFHSGALLDCGGGVVVDLDPAGEEVFSERKVEALRRDGLVVYLQRDPETVLEKISGDPNRPALSDTQSFLELMERRDPWYRAAADLVLDCTKLRKSEVAEEILEWFLANQGVPRAGAGR